MADDVRRFDSLERTVRDTKRDLADLRRTALARIGMVSGGSGGTSDHGALTGLADDDHTQYHTDARGDLRYSLLAHDHDADYDAAGTAAAAVTAHEAALNPHPTYLTAAEGDAAYAALAHDHDADYQPLDSDLTTIAGLGPSDGQLLRRVAGAWAAYTLSATDIATGTLPIAQVPTGTSGTTVALGDHGHDDLTDLDAGESAHVSTTQSTTSTAYTDLATAGPAVSVTLAEARRVLVVVKARLFQVGAVARVYMSFAATGATTQAAVDNNAVQHNGSGNDEAYAAVGFVDCNAGTTTFTAKYRVQANTGEFALRTIAVIPT